MKLRLAVAAVALSVVALPQAQAPPSSKSPTIEQFLSPAYPLDLTSAKKADRIAWVSYDEGKRNIYTAAAPGYQPVRLTSFLKDDGTDMTDPNLSDDGAIVVFVRGHTPNRDGWVANPSSDPAGSERAIWAVRTAGGPAWRVAEGFAPELAPDGSSVLFVRDGQIFRARVTPTRPIAPIDRGETPFIKAWGTNSAPRWSPDGRKIAFVSSRVDHSFIGIYDVATRTVNYMAPSVDRDTSPTWSLDGTRSRSFAGPGCRSASRPSRAVAGSECQTDRPSIRRRKADVVQRQAAAAGKAKVAGRAADVVAKRRPRRRRRRRCPG